jgi:hypothetical protein
MVKVDIFYEILWPQFKQLREIRNLSESQQIREYNFYLQELELQRIAYLKWLEGRTKGGSEEDNYSSDRYIPTPPLSGFLLQENDFYILQEDGDKIYL